jgi:hypothetical protein
MDDIPGTILHKIKVERDDTGSEDEPTTLEMVVLQE